MKSVLKITVAAILVVVLLMPLFATTEDACPSPSVEDFYGVNSDFFNLSSVSHHLSVYDVMMVDFDENEVNVYESGQIDGYFNFPLLPDRLVLVILYDGGNYIAPASFNLVSPYCIHARFYLEDLRNFSTYTGLYLILVEYLL